MAVKNARRLGLSNDTLMITSRKVWIVWNANMETGDIVSQVKIIGGHPCFTRAVFLYCNVDFDNSIK